VEGALGGRGGIEDWSELVSFLEALSWLITAAGMFLSSLSHVMTPKLLTFVAFFVFLAPEG
jgi:hypothetical protein